MFAGYHLCNDLGLTELTEDMDIISLLQQLNSTDENHQIEAKRGSDIDKSFFESVCSFSNEPDLGGGYILLGVSKDEESLFPSYKIVGVHNPDELSQRIASQCASYFNIRIRPRIETHTIKGKVVVGVFVPELFHTEKPAFIQNIGLPRGAYRRIGSTDQSCTDDDMVVFYGDRKADAYDSTALTSADMSDIDPDAVEFYRQLRGKINSSAEELRWNNEELLKAFSCIAKINGSWYPTAAGILLFGTRQALRRLFPMMRVDYIRVSGKEWIENATDRFSTVDMRGPLLQLVQRVQSAVADDLPKGFVLLEGEIQAQSPSLSTRVLREAIVNALMHRSYKAHEPVQVIRYSNRLEILNPGYSLKAEERLGEPGSQNRNPNIAGVFHETNIAETKGSGIKTMRRLMQEANFAPPTFDSNRRDNKFTARLLLQHFLDPTDLVWLARFDIFNLNEHQKKALIFVRETGQINNPSFRQLNGVDTLPASKDLRAMCIDRILEMKGKSIATYYEPGPAYHEVVAPTQGIISPTQRVSSPIQETISPIQGAERIHYDPIVAGAFEGLSSEIALKLDTIRSSKRSKSNDVRNVILALCRIRPLTSGQLAVILSRASPMLVGQYLSPMIASGELQYLIPDNLYHRKQAYIASE